MNESSAAANPPSTSAACTCAGSGAHESTGYGGDRSAKYVGEATESQLMERLDEVLTGYQGKPGALIPVLQIAQGIFGYLPQNVLKRIALRLGKSYSEVAGVVGFYSFFSTVPRGRHLVRVCLGTACYVRGGKQVMEACKQELGIDVGGTTPDGLFTLEVGRCFGACGLAPTIMIDEDVHQRVKPPKLRALFAAYRSGDGAATNPPSTSATNPPSTSAAKAGGNGGAKSARKPAPKAPAKKTSARNGRKPSASSGSGRREKMVAK